MPDIISRVRFIGDSSQLLATYRAIGAQSQALQQQLNNVVRTNLRGVGLDPGTDAASRFFDKSQSKFITQYTRAFKSGGPIIKNLRTELDSINKTFRVTGDTAIRTAGGVEFLTGKYEGVIGNSERVLESAQKLNRIYSNTQPIRNNTKAIFAHAEALKNQGKVLRYGDFAQFGGLTAPSGRNAGTIASLGQIKNAAIEQQRAQLGALNAINDTKVAYRELIRSYGASPPIPASIQQLMKYPDLFNQLKQRGLGIDKAGTFSAGQLYNQQATAAFERDLVTGVTKARGSFIDSKGVPTRWAAELDEAGRSITRFGRNMSGMQNFLRQTVANFQKVIQWTVATTAVFGGLAFAARELGVLVDVDKTLRQLGITANLTQQETKGLFSDIADVAYQTATPLSEMLKATDDIALAVREAGKSAEQYRTDIVNLTEAVGIYTNLTGQDTVKATDTLVATMKQLGLETTDLIGLLSKVTAVSGGQSNAIADVSVGLGVMAEAARQAGLDVDQTIATVQVLSQVTSKSPAEVATAFKNLVGALDSRAGTKALKEFGISLRDESGNLRNILDIYGEIADKIRQGVIPEADVKGLVKAIAGGPRRAPDAAALLSAIADIEEAVQRSKGASNEAVIANAKIVDTISARMTKLQVQIDRFAFEKFGAGLKEASEGILNALDAVLGILNQLDTGFIAAAIQVGAFVLALRVALGLGRFIKNEFLGLGFTLKGLSAAYREAAASAQAYGTSAVTASKAGRLGAFGGALFGGRGTAATLGLGAIAGAGLSAVSGGNPLAGALTGAGLTALTVPLPLPWLKVAGAISLAAGTLLEFAGNSEEAGKSSEETAQDLEKLLNAFNRYKEAVSIIESGTETQKELAIAIQTRQQAENKTADDLAVLNDLQKQYVQNTLEMVDANKQLKESLAEISTIDPQLALDAEAARRGELSAADLKRKIDQYTLDFLRRTDVGANLEDVQIPEIKNVGAVPREGLGFLEPISTGQAVPSPSGKQPQQFSGFNIYQIKSDANEVKKIFNDTFTDIDTQIPKTGVALDIISAAIQELANEGDSAAPAMKRLFDNFLIGADSIRGADVILDKFQQKLGIISVLDPEQGSELQKVLDLVKEIIAAAQASGDTETIFDTLTGYSKVFSGEVEVTDEYVRGLAETYAELNGLLDENVTMEQFINEILDQRGITQETLNAAKEHGLTLSAEELEATLAAQEALTETVRGIQASNAERTAQLSAQIKSGELEGPELKNAEQQIAQLNAISEGVERVNLAYQEAAAGGIVALDSAMQGLAGQFTSVLGLQDAQNLSASQLIERMFSLAETYGLTGEQTNKLTKKLQSLLGSIQLINGQKATFLIEGKVNLGPIIQNFRNAAQALSGLPFGIGTGLSGLFNGIASALAAYQGIYYAGKVKDQLSGGGGLNFSGAGGSTNGGGGSGGGSRGGSGVGGTSAGYDTSLIDIPDAIAQAYNRDALIQEAIRRAKSLQSKIPGAAKEAKNDIVEVMLGTQRLIEVRGVKDDLLRRALEELADIEKKRLEFESKADTIRRIRVGAGDFAALANVPLNTRTGVSVGSAQGPITVNLNINGQLLTPAQFSSLADQIAAAIKRQIGA